MYTYRSRLLLRLLMLMTTMATIPWLAFQEGYLGMSILLLIASLVQVWLLFRFLDRSDLLLRRFFESLSFDDFTARFSPGKRAPFQGLEQSLEQVMDRFRNIRAEKEEGYRYLEAVIHHLSIPTLAIRDDEHIHLSNPAARRLLEQPRLMELTDIGTDLALFLRQLPHGAKEAFRFHRGQEVVPLLVSASRFQLREHHYLLVSFQDIRREVERAETEAWQRLTRVLRHEILNSLTPVTTLTRTLDHMVFSKTGLREHEDLQHRQHDIREALGLIQRRSEGLMSFVQTYREVTRLPQPQWEELFLCELLESVRQLFARRFLESGIRVEARCFPEKLKVEGDPSLLEQVLINLVLNARDALPATGGEIRMEGRLSARGQAEIEVSDTGPGVPPGLEEEIFTPFFTTKPEGQGIGLSVSRQIMLAHGGELLLMSEAGKGARFVMRLG